METREIKLAKGTLRVARNASLLASIAFGSQLLCNLSGNIVNPIINNGVMFLGIGASFYDAMMKHKIYKDFDIECAVGLKKALNIQKRHFNNNGTLSLLTFYTMLLNFRNYFQDGNMAHAFPITLWCLCGLGYGTAHMQYKRLQTQLVQEKVKTLK